MAAPGAQLPPNCQLRPAQARDQWPLRRLVLGAFLDPTQIRWSQFWVIETEEQIIACGQLRQFPGAQELGSLVVARPWRGQGLGSYLSDHLIAQAHQPLFLECLGQRLTRFYQHRGFVPAQWSQLPVALRRKFALSHLACRWGLPLTIMVYPPSLTSLTVAPAEP